MWAVVLPFEVAVIPQSLVEGEHIWLLAKEDVFYDHGLHSRPNISIITKEDLHH